MPSQQFSRSHSSGKKWDSYRILGCATLVLVLPFLIHALAPQTADAFAPFAHTAHAQTSGEEAILHDPSIDLLDAATNPDPNPIKNGEHVMEVANGAALMTHADIVDATEVAPTRRNDSSPIKSGIAVYTVQEGDSLSEIAEEYGVSVDTILWANDIRDIDSIQIGDDLIILPVSGVRYTVKSGDTLSTIAAKFGSNADDIALFNAMEVDGVLALGTEVIIPDGAFPSSESSKKTVASSAKSSSNKASSSDNGKFSNPLPGAVITQANHGYNAVDLDGETGDPIYASSGGTVLIAKGSGWNGGYGTYVVLEHGGGVQTLYAHMSKIEVAGGTVEKGEVIGYVGNTGKSTGSHLHFEVRGATNPL